MPELKELAHFLYGQGFWYADPMREIRDLTEEQLFWVPGPMSLPIIWQLGHIAHRERFHIGFLLQGLPGLIPPQHEVFGPEWRSLEEIRASVRSVPEVLDWFGDVRRMSQEYIDSLSDEDWDRIPPDSEGQSVARWVFITTAHTALHIGRMQLLRALIEGKQERAC